MPRKQKPVHPWELAGLLTVLAAGCLGIASLLHMNNVPNAYAVHAQPSQPQQLTQDVAEGNGLKLLPLSIPTQSPSLPAERAAWTSLPEIKTVPVKAAPKPKPTTAKPIST